MERRREPRFFSNERAFVTVLGATEIILCAEAVDVSGRGLKLHSTIPIAAGAAVKIQMNDSLMLGEVCYSAPDGGRFTIGIKIEQMLTGLKELARLRSRLVEPSPRQRDFRRADAS